MGWKGLISFPTNVFASVTFSHGSCELRQSEGLEGSFCLSIGGSHFPPFSSLARFTHTRTSRETNVYLRRFSVETPPMEIDGEYNRWPALSVWVWFEKLWISDCSREFIGVQCDWTMLDFSGGNKILLLCQAWKIDVMTYLVGGNQWGSYTRAHIQYFIL